MLIGYARVSTHDQNLNLQRDALRKEGYEKIYMDKITGKTLDRDQLDNALDVLRQGDSLVVWRFNSNVRFSAVDFSSLKIGILL